MWGEVVHLLNNAWVQGQLCLILPMEKGGVDGHVTVLCLIIYLGYRVSLAIWHTEFVFFRGCPGDLVSTFKLRRKQCCPKSSLLTFPTLACVFFLWCSEWKGPSWSLRGWHQSHRSWLHAVQRIPSQSGAILADSAHHWVACLCTLTAGLGNLIKMCLLWIIVQSSSERETVMVYGMSIKTRYVRDQVITAKTWCFPPSASLLRHFS